MTLRYLQNKANRFSKKRSKNEEPSRKRSRKRLKKEVLRRNEYDGIVFVAGHSSFAESGTLCHIGTTGKMKQKTLLIGDVGNKCIMCIQPDYLEQHIEQYYKDALYLTDTQIEEISHRFKIEEKEAVNANFSKFNQNIVEKFYKSRGKFSESPYEFCERSWDFFQQESPEYIREGVVILLHIDETGNPKFEPLFEVDMVDEKFSIKKSDLLEYLYNDGYRNVLVVDFGCASTTGLCKSNIDQLIKGYLGGRKRRFRRK